MKTKFKKLAKVILLFTLIFMLSCEKDMYENAIYNTSKDKVNYVNIDAVPFLVPSIQKFNKNYSYLSRTSKSSANLNIEDLNLNLDEILEYVKENGIKSYSIKIINKLDSEKYTENLHIAEFNEKYETFILRWVPDNSNVELHLKSFTGKVMCFDIDYNIKNTKTFVNGKIVSNNTGKNNSTAKSNFAEPTCTYDIQSCWCKGELIGDEHICTTAIYVFCSGGGGGGGGVTGFGTPVTSGSGTGASGGQTGTGETSSSVTSTDDPIIIVAPNFDTYQQNFVNSLGKSKGYFYELHPETQKIIFKYLSFTEYEDPNKTIVKNALIQIDLNWLKQQPSINEIIIAAFLFNNEFSTESQSIVTQLKDQITQNPNLNFDIEASLNSPFNIDKLAITDATPEGKKFNKIYEVLKNSVLYKNLFINLFDRNDRINVKFELVPNLIGKDGKKINGNCSEPTLGINGGKYITIKINKDNLSSAPAPNTLIFNIKTIIHESIHAYLYMKKVDANNGIPIPGLSNEDFAAALQGYNYFTGDQDQHDFMFLKMVPTIKIILSQIRDAVITQDRIDYFKDQSILHNPGIPTTLWTWEEYYGWLSLGGLEQSPSFKKKYPEGSDGETVFRDYLYRAELNLNKEF